MTRGVATAAAKGGWRGLVTLIAFALFLGCVDVSATFGFVGVLPLTFICLYFAVEVEQLREEIRSSGHRERIAASYERTADAEERTAEIMARLKR